MGNRRGPWHFGERLVERRPSQSRGHDCIGGVERISEEKGDGYVLVQLLAAMAASAMIYLLFADAVQRFENHERIVRGQPGSEASAMIFGEYFPNPGAKPLPPIKAPLMLQARSCVAEGLGTALLLLVVCTVSEKRAAARFGGLAPWAIGLTITVLICLIAPLTMAGFNPARDLGPRIFSSLAGWKSIPFQANGIGWLTVYVLSPIAGGLVGAGMHHLLLADRGAD